MEKILNEDRYKSWFSVLTHLEVLKDEFMALRDLGLCLKNPLKESFGMTLIYDGYSYAKTIPFPVPGTEDLQESLLIATANDPKVSDTDLRTAIYEFQGHILNRMSQKDELVDLVCRLQRDLVFSGGLWRPSPAWVSANFMRERCTEDIVCIFIEKRKN